MNHTNTNNKTNENLVQGISANRINENNTFSSLNKPNLYHYLREQKIELKNSSDASHFFSEVPTFVSRVDYQSISQSINAIEAVLALPKFREYVSARNGSKSLSEYNTPGAFISYDFHLSDSACPQLIEINTNAGGAFLNVALLAAQSSAPIVTECNAEPHQNAGDLKLKLQNMVTREWRSFSANGELKSIAIIDESPNTQFLYPDFILAQNILSFSGIRTYIASPEQLQTKNKQLYFGSTPIDFIYNRLTDFDLSLKKHTALRNAFESSTTLITPNPLHHSIFADKRNLTVFSDRKLLTTLGASTHIIDIIRSSVPKTYLVNPNNQDETWQNRRNLFFKPIAGFASKAAYNGGKITKKVWENITKEQYVAQSFVPPTYLISNRNNSTNRYKIDIRAYTYQGDIILLAARLYRGQTTNFRTLGGGFSPIYIV